MIPTPPMAKILQVGSGVAMVWEMCERGDGRGTLGLGQAAMLRASGKRIYCPTCCLCLAQHSPPCLWRSPSSAAGQRHCICLSASLTKQGWWTCCQARRRSGRWSGWRRRGRWRWQRRYCRARRTHSRRTAPAGWWGGGQKGGEIVSQLNEMETGG